MHYKRLTQSPTKRSKNGTFSIYFQEDLIKENSQRILQRKNQAFWKPDFELVDSGAYEWQQRPLESTYVVVHFFMYAIKQNSGVQSKFIFTCYALSPEGIWDILGIWCSDYSNKIGWQYIINDLKKRGVQNIFFATIDEDSELTTMLNATFADICVTFCISRLIMDSMRHLPHRLRDEFHHDLKKIYHSTSSTQVSNVLSEFIEIWGARFPQATQKWCIHSKEIADFLNYPREFRKILSLHKTIELILKILRKASKLGSDEEMFMFLYATLQSKRQELNTRELQIIKQFI